MFDHPDKPQPLINLLIAPVEDYYGTQRWYGAPQEKLAESPLPEPLARLYAS